MSKSKYKKRETYYTSRIFKLPSWVCTVSVLFAVALGCVLLVSGLSDGAIDPLKICNISNVMLTGDKGAESSLKEVTYNFYDYKDMPYDYKKEVEETYNKMSGKFTPETISKGSGDTYVFTSAEYSVGMGEDSPLAVIRYTTDKIKSAKDIKKDEAIKFNGEITAIGVMNKTKTVDDKKITFQVYTYYVSNVKDGENNVNTTR